MSDTQWPRYFVFKQDAADEPHLNCGTVHAPDPELALQNARDVFVRRPECVSLWVVPAERVLAKTAQELEASLPDLPADNKGSSEPFAVFLKRSHRDQHAYAADVKAASEQEALALAFDRWTDEDPEVYWVVARSAIRTSEIGDEESWFAPARDKLYRNQAFYRTESLMREIKAEREAGEEGKS